MGKEKNPFELWLEEQRATATPARARPRSAEYTAHLRSPEWARLRDRALAHADWRCQLCNRPDDLDAHHRTYERLGHEHLEDLTVLCRTCHDRHHDAMP